MTEEWKIIRDEGHRHALTHFTDKYHEMLTEMLFKGEDIKPMKGKLVKEVREAIDIDLQSETMPEYFWEIVYDCLCNVNAEDLVDEMLDNVLLDWANDWRNSGNDEDDEVLKCLDSAGTISRDSLAALVYRGEYRGGETNPETGDMFQYKLSDGRLMNVYTKDSFPDDCTDFQIIGSAERIGIEKNGQIPGRWECKTEVKDI